MNGHSQITIELPQSEIEFVRSFAEKKNMSIDAVIDSLIKNLERVIEHPIDPKIKSWVGILPSDTDVDALRMEYLAEKYLRDDRNN
jgi:hypothetical protein